MSAAEVKLSDQRLVKLFSSSLSKFAVVEARQAGVSLPDQSGESLPAGRSENMPQLPNGGGCLRGEGSPSPFLPLRVWLWLSLMSAL